MRVVWLSRRWPPAAKTGIALPVAGVEVAAWSSNGSGGALRATR
jgi:hypothetical protein